MTETNQNASKIVYSYQQTIVDSNGKPLPEDAASKGDINAFLNVRLEGVYLPKPIKEGEKVSINDLAADLTRIATADFDFFDQDKSQGVSIAEFLKASQTEIPQDTRAVAETVLYRKTNMLEMVMANLAKIKSSDKDGDEHLNSEEMKQYVSALNLPKQAPKEIDAPAIK